MPPETRFVGAVYNKRRSFGDMRLGANRLALAEWMSGERTKFRELGIDRDEFIRQAVDGPGSLGSVIGIAFRMYAERFGKPRWGDKRPSYVKQVDMLVRLFPDAQFVHLIRDGRDCVSSLKEMPWFKHDSFHAISIWAEAIDAGRRLRKTMPEDSYYELRYEDLTDDPATELKKLCYFLDEDFDPAMCSPHEVASVAVPVHKVWHSNTHGEVMKSRVGSWSARLDEWEIRLCEQALGKRLEANGYELTGVPQAAMEHVARLQKVMQKRRGARLRKSMRDRFLRFREPGPVAALLTSTQRSLAGVPQQRTEAEIPQRVM